MADAPDEHVSRKRTAGRRWSADAEDHRRSVNTEGVQVAPMRSTEAELPLAVIVARRGEVEQAGTLGVRALQNRRRSRPSLLMVVAELGHELDVYGVSAVADFRQVVADVRHHP
jgi:hypothetical protein